MRTLKNFTIFMMVVVFSISAQAEEIEKSDLEKVGDVLVDIADAEAQHETAEWTLQKVCFGKDPTATPMLIALVAIFCAIAGKFRYKKSWLITAIALIAVARLIVFAVEESEANQTLVMWMSIGLTPVVILLLTIKWWKQLFLARRRKCGWKFFWSDKMRGSSVKVTPEMLRQIGMGQPLAPAQPAPPAPQPVLQPLAPAQPVPNPLRQCPQCRQMSLGVMCALCGYKTQNHIIAPPQDDVIDADYSAIFDDSF